MFGHHDDKDDKKPAVEDAPEEAANQVVHPHEDEAVPAAEAAPAEETSTQETPTEEAPATDSTAAASDANAADGKTDDAAGAPPVDVTATPTTDNNASDADADADTTTTDTAADGTAVKNDDKANEAATGESGDSQDPAWQHPGEPLDDSPEQISDVIYPAGLPKPPTMQPGGAPSSGPAADDDHDNHDDASVHELIDIKVKALSELSPLVDELDLPAEDKFRTIMMMIQANDNQELISKAYATAHEIEDEKARAQALMDIVNEINYFTQSRSDHDQAED